MKEACILYESYGGFTRRYAEWLAEALAGEALSLKDFAKRPWRPASVLVFGGGVHGNRINGLRRFRAIARAHPDCKSFYFATGLRLPEARMLKLLYKENFGKSQSVPFFYLEGGLALSRLPVSQRMLLVALRAMLDRRENLSEAERVLQKRLSYSEDYSTREQLAPLISCIRETLSQSSCEAAGQG